MQVHLLKRVRLSCQRAEWLSCHACIHSCHRIDNLTSSHISCENLDEVASLALQMADSCNQKSQYYVQIAMLDEVRRNKH